MSSYRWVGKIFYMTGCPSRSLVGFSPNPGRVVALNRTIWKPESYRMELYSYPKEIGATLIRTCRKNQPDPAPQGSIKSCDFKFLSDRSVEKSPKIQGKVEFRTWWKINSYPVEFFTGRIRTHWNSNRTGRKVGPEIIGEFPQMTGPINTFLFISKGEEKDDSLKH